MPNCKILVLFLLLTNGCYRQGGKVAANDTSKSLIDASAPSDEEPDTITSEDETASLSTEEGTGSVWEELGTEPLADTNTAQTDCTLRADIRWGTDCMMDHIDPVFILNAGDTVDDKSTRFDCIARLPPCPDENLVDASDINALLLDPDLLSALEVDYPSFGVQTSSSYYIALKFEGSDDFIYLSVGDPCNGESSCVPIPASLGELKLLLDTIVENPETYSIGTEESVVRVCEYHN